MGIGASSTCREVEIGWIKYRLHPTGDKETCCCCGSVWHCACVDMMQHKSMVTSFLVALAPGLESMRPIQWGHSDQMFSLPPLKERSHLLLSSTPQSLEYYKERVSRKHPYFCLLLGLRAELVYPSLLFLTRVNDLS